MKNNFLSSADQRERINQLKRELEDLDNQLCNTDRLDEIDVPVLIISGEFDEARPVTMEGFASKMPDARVEVVPGAGHAAPAERPYMVATMVTSFLQEVEQRPTQETNTDTPE